MSGRMEKWSVKFRTYDMTYESRSAIKSQELLDFVADFSDDLRDEVEIEAKQSLEEENVGRWMLFTYVESNQRGTGLGSY